MPQPLYKCVTCGKEDEVAFSFNKRKDRIGPVSRTTRITFCLNCVKKEQEEWRQKQAAALKPKEKPARIIPASKITKEPVPAKGEIKHEWPRTSLQVSPEENARLRETAKLEGKPLHEVIRNAFLAGWNKTSDAADKWAKDKPPNDGAYWVWDPSMGDQPVLCIDLQSMPGLTKESRFLGPIAIPKPPLVRDPISHRRSKQPRTSATLPAISEESPPEIGNLGVALKQAGIGA